MLRLATPKDDKRLEEELLELDSKDIEIYYITQKIDGYITPQEILKMGGNGFSEKDISTTLYKLYRNGKIRLIYNDGWHYTRWN